MTRLVLILSLLMLIALPTAFAQDGDAPLDGVTFLPIEAIVDDEIVVTDFRADGTALLPVFTNIPVACTVIYGTTTEFGSITQDQNMASPATQDHNPILTGLEPETTYYFRLQGVDEMGTIYLSETMTFETPAFDSFQSENLASALNGAEVVGQSSGFGGAGLDERWGANNAFDDNPNTEWSSDGDGDGAWVEVQLARRARVERVEFWSRAMSDGSAITTEFTVTTETGEVFGPFTLPDTEGAYEFPIEIEAESLRFDLVSTTGGNTGAVDIAVYGEFIE